MRGSYSSAEMQSVYSTVPAEMAETFMKIQRILLFGWLFGWLVGFYGKLTFVAYLIPNPVHTYIIYMICKQIVCRKHF